MFNSNLEVSHQLKINYCFKRSVITELNYYQLNDELHKTHKYTVMVFSSCWSDPLMITRKKLCLQTKLAKKRKHNVFYLRSIKELSIGDRC